MGRLQCQAHSRHMSATMTYRGLSRIRLCCHGLQIRCCARHSYSQWQGGVHSSVSVQHLLHSCLLQSCLCNISLQLSQQHPACSSPSRVSDAAASASAIRASAGGSVAVARVWKSALATAQSTAAVLPFSFCSTAWVIWRSNLSYSCRQDVADSAVESSCCETSLKEMLHRYRRANSTLPLAVAMARAASALQAMAAKANPRQAPVRHGDAHESGVSFPLQTSL